MSIGYLDRLSIRDERGKQEHGGRRSMETSAARRSMRERAGAKARRTGRKVCARDAGGEPDRSPLDFLQTWPGTESTRLGGLRPSVLRTRKTDLCRKPNDVYAGDAGGESFCCANRTSATRHTEVRAGGDDSGERLSRTSRTLRARTASVKGFSSRQ